MSISIKDPCSGHVAKVDEGYLMVCLCDETCNGHADLIEFLSGLPVNILLHVKDENGDIVPLSKKETE